MSEPENFLSRWSRRKLEVDQELGDSSGVPAAEASAPSEAETTPKTPADDCEAAAKEKAEAFDLSALPSIESITEATDIRMFLQKGVPAHLTRAALRRAWTSDPAIRDFREIAENQYDFATGSDLPGFGSLDASAEEIRKLVANVFGEQPASVVSAEFQLPRTEIAAEPDSSKAVEVARQQDAAATVAAEQPMQQEPPAGIVHRNENIAMQQVDEHPEGDQRPTRRSHGRALPQ